MRSEWLAIATMSPEDSGGSHLRPRARVPVMTNGRFE